MIETKIPSNVQPQQNLMSTGKSDDFWLILCLWLTPKLLSPPCIHRYYIAHRWHFGKQVTLVYWVALANRIWLYQTDDLHEWTSLFCRVCVFFLFTTTSRQYFSLNYLTLSYPLSHSYLLGCQLFLRLLPPQQAAWRHLMRCKMCEVLWKQTCRGGPGPGCDQEKLTAEHKLDADINTGFIHLWSQMLLKIHIFEYICVFFIFMLVWLILLYLTCS